MTDEEKVMCKLRGFHPSAIMFMSAWMNAKQCSLDHVLEMMGKGLTPHHTVIQEHLK